MTFSITLNNNLPSLICDEQLNIVETNQLFSALSIAKLEKLNPPADVSNQLTNSDTKLTDYRLFQLISFDEIKTLSQTNGKLITGEIAQCQVSINLIVQEVNLNNKTHFIISLIEIPQVAEKQLTTDKRQPEVSANTGVVNHNKLQTLAESAGLGVWEYNINQQQAYFTDAFKTLLKLAKTQSLNWLDLLDKIFIDDRDIFSAFFQSHIVSDTPLELELRIYVAGKIKWFKIRGFKQTVNSEALVVGYIIDYSLEKEILNELSQTMEGKELALEAGNIGTWSTHLDLQTQAWIWNWDTRASGIFHLSLDDTGNLEKWSNTLHPDDKHKVMKALENTLSQGVDFEESYRAIVNGDELIYVYAKGVCRKKMSGELISIDGICIEQTQEYRIQNELRRLNTQLEERVVERTKQLASALHQAEQASKAKSDFLSMMSHELRTPMNAVIGSLDLLSMTEQNYESQDLIDTAKTSANNLVFILNDILDLNKIEAGKMELEVVPFSISEIIDNVIKIFLPETQKKGIILDVREDPNIPLCIEGDPVRIRQIIFNLVGNAIKFTSSTETQIGKVLLDVSIEHFDGNVYQVSFLVKDNGIGINSDVQKKLFSPFIQAERSTTRKYGGTGLGLAICGKLTDIMGGEISLQSEENIGSDFLLKLPLWRNTKPLDEHKLDSVEVSIINLNKYLSKLATRLQAYLEAEKAIVSLSCYCEDQIVNTTQPIILMTGECDLFKAELTKIHNNISSQQHVILIIDRVEKAKAQTQYPKFDLILIKPATRAQLIANIEKLMVRFNQVETVIDIDEFGLDELELTDSNINDSNKYINKNSYQKSDSTFFQPKQDSSNQLKPASNTQTSSTSDIKHQANVDNEVSLYDVLVVEDNPLNQKLVSKQMEKLGYQFCLAGDGLEGIELWQSKAFKVILTDCHMPNLNGYDMTKKIREIEDSKSNVSPIPIIAFTGAAMSGDMDYCLSIGMNDFLSKPIELAKLKSTMSKWIK